jgi:hypothetical protein
MLAIDLRGRAGNPATLLQSPRSKDVRSDREISALAEDARLSRLKDDERRASPVYRRA